MEHLTPRDYRTMAWRNGGGQTTEIAIGPRDAGLDGTPFLWRVSIADVARDGPFSAFPGYDRILTVIDGGGLMLEGGGARPIEIGERFRPVPFSGDRPLEGRLIGGPVRDFNVMTLAASARARVTIHHIGPEPLTISGTASVLILHSFEGEPISLDQGERRLGPGETLIERDRTAPAYELTLRCDGGTSPIAIVEIELR